MSDTQPVTPAAPEPSGPAVISTPADGALARAGRAWPGMRVRTLVLGLILLVVSGSVLTSELTGATVDPGVVGLSLMVGAGLLLLAGSATRRN